MNSSMEKTEIGLSSEFKENLTILRGINFFSKLPLDTLKVLAYLCVRETFKAGEYLFHQKEDDGRALYIITGKAQLEHQNDQTLKTIRDVDNGAFLGSLALLGEAPRLFTLKATTDITCLVMARNKFLKVIEQFPDIMPKVLYELINSIHTWEKRFLSSSDQSCQNCIRNVGVSLV